MPDTYPAPINGVYPCNDAVKNPATMASSVIRAAENNTVYQFKQAYDAANPGTPFKFASAVDRMAYIQGRGNAAPQGGGCGYTPPN